MTAMKNRFVVEALIIKTTAAITATGTIAWGISNMRKIRVSCKNITIEEHLQHE